MHILRFKNLFSARAVARRDVVNGRQGRTVLSHKAADNGCLSKVEQILLDMKKAVRPPTQDAVNSKFGIDKLLIFSSV
jgi:hypothetical protein